MRLKNKPLDREIRRLIDLWGGTMRGARLATLFNMSASYAEICEFADIDIGNFREYWEE